MPSPMNDFSPPAARPPFLQTYVTWLLVFLALTGLIDLFLGDAERAINIHHIIAGLGAAIFFAYGRVAMPTITINIFFASLLLVSGIAALQHGIHPMFYNALYCFYLCLLGLLCAQILKPAQLSAALRTSAWIILGAITIKNVFYLHDIMDTLATLQDRVFIPTVVAGGPNMEATFALFAVAMLRGSRGYWPAFAYALFLAILYSSRAPILGAAMLFAYEIVAPQPNAAPIFGQFRIVGLIIGALVITIVLFSSPITQFALSRFEDIGYEPGSEGRLDLWQTAPQVFLEHPFGVGAGNSIHAVEMALGHDVQEDNLHNIYLQILLDLGIVGFAAYAAMIYATARRGIINKTLTPLWLAIGLYFLMGTLQFRAYDPFFFFWLGLAWYDKSEDAIA